MTFWIDGYNLLFYLDEANPLQKKREELLEELHLIIERAGIEAVIVFDAKEFSKSRFKTLDVVYTPKGVSADTYILEHVQKDHHVVSNDKFLCREARDLRVKVMSVKQFVQYLLKKVKKGTPAPKPLPKPPKDLIKDREFDRHAKIFEERLKLYEEGKLD